jgi:hypothetical protein
MNINTSTVVTRKDFIELISTLQKNLIEHPEEWENLTLAKYLEAVSAWTQDMDGYYKNNNLPIPIEPSWSNLADIFIAAKTYE